MRIVLFDLGNTLEHDGAKVTLDQSREECTTPCGIEMSQGPARS